MGHPNGIHIICTHTNTKKKCSNVVFALYNTHSCSREYAGAGTTIHSSEKVIIVSIRPQNSMLSYFIDGMMEFYIPLSDTASEASEGKKGFAFC